MKVYIKPIYIQICIEGIFLKRTFISILVKNIYKKIPGMHFAVINMEGSSMVPLIFISMPSFGIVKPVCDNVHIYAMHTEMS